MTRIAVPSGVAPARVGAHRWGARSYWPASLPEGGSNAFGSAVAPSSGGSAHTKGSWVEVTAATTADVYRIAMQTAVSFASGANTAGLLDIGIGGAGSEVVIVPNLAVGYSSATVPGALPLWDLPVFIPKGTRVAVRWQSARTSQALNTYWTLYGPTSTTRATPRPAPFTWAYGPDTSTSLGVTLVPAAANAKGSWVQLTAATDGPIAGLAVGVQGNGLTVMQGGTVLVDIAAGAAGSEVVILPNLAFATSTSELVLRSHMLTTYPVDLPAGVRLAARCSNSGGSTSVYYVDASVCAIPRSG